MTMGVVTLEDLDRRLASFTYKPGWTMSLSPSLRFGPAANLVITFQTEDTYRSGQDTLIGFHEPLPPIEYFQKIEAFDHWLLGVIDKAERHETREWLKRDGVMIFDPHKGGR